MAYAADLTFDLEFRGDNALAHDLDRATWESPGGDPAAYGWAIVASFSEFASGALDGLHLTGVGDGRLLDGFAERLRLLAIHADGVVAGVGEDGTRWSHPTASNAVGSSRCTGQAGVSLGGSGIALPSVIIRQSIGCRWPAFREVGSGFLALRSESSVAQDNGPLPDGAHVHSPVTYHCR